MAGMTLNGGTTFRYRWGQIVNGIVAVVGLWQIVAPFVLDFANEQVVLWNAIVSGVLLALFGALAFFGTGRWSRSVIRTFEALAAVVGLWLLISPWVLAYQSIAPAFWSALIVGLFCFVAELIAAMKQPEGAAIGS